MLLRTLLFEQIAWPYLGTVNVFQVIWIIMKLICKNFKFSDVSEDKYKVQ